MKRKKEVEKEFDRIFPTIHRKACVAARWKAFFVSFFCWEGALAMIMYAIGFIIPVDDTAGLAVIITFAAIILVFTFATTGVSFDNKREELLDEYFGEKIRDEKE